MFLTSIIGFDDEKGNKANISWESSSEGKILKKIKKIEKVLMFHTRESKFKNNIKGIEDENLWTCDLISFNFFSIINL